MAKISLQEKKIQELVDRSVKRAFRELLTDPDRGLELTAYAKRRLNHSIASKKSGKIISLSNALARYK